MKSEWRIRIVGERDMSLGAEAYRLLCRILSARVWAAARHHDPLWEPFPLPWTMVAAWLGLARRRCYDLLGELEARGYLKHQGVFGCPGKAHYRMVEAMADNPPFKIKPGRGAISCTPRGAKNCTPRDAKKRTPRGAEKGAPLTKYSLREEMSTRKGRNGSLRSKANEREKVGSLRSKLTDEKRSQFGSELAKLKAKLKGGPA